MNDKPHSNSVIAGLTQEQRDLIERWLMDENVSYMATAGRCRKEFGVTVHHTALRKFVQQMNHKRTLDRIGACAQQANEVVKAFTDNPAELFKVIVKIVGQWVFEAMMNPTKKRDLKLLERLLELLVQLRKDEREAGRFELERERWEFDVARLCFEHHMELQSITVDVALDEDARLLAIRRRLFGAVLPD